MTPTYSARVSGATPVCRWVQPRTGQRRRNAGPPAQTGHGSAPLVQVPAQARHAPGATR
ncbi:MAG: hypothetical protein JSR84_06065 [Proteobacteria bacterium]|nr:hypothetical protein [Pseudomonadota bacterium]